MSQVGVCSVCYSSSSETRVFLEENIDEGKFSSFSYASRKDPEFMCYQLLRCPVCDVVYVEHPVSQEDLALAYHQSDFDSTEEADAAAQTYMKAMAPILEKIENKGLALEIGTGTGILLDHLKGVGFEKVMGVEPSPAAIAAAPDHRREWIIENIFVESDFEPNSCDLITCFMTLEHVRFPKELLASCYRLLRPGGAVVFVTHNYRSIVNRILGRRSPIIDIEHMQIFSHTSMSYLLKEEGFADVDVKPFLNRYRIHYWVRLLPFSTTFKIRLTRLISALGFSKVQMSIGVGNIMSSGFKF